MLGSNTLKRPVQKAQYPLSVMLVVLFTTTI